MKKVLLPIALCLSLMAGASAPQTVTYQAVVRNSAQKLVRLKPVGVRISILWGGETGTSVYTETRRVTTNVNGLLTFAIGDEEAVTGDDLSRVNWGDGPYFIKCEMDPTGGSNYTIESTSQLMSVPYAIYAERISPNATPAWTQTAEKPVYNYSEIVGAPDIKNLDEQDSEFKKSVAAGISAADTARWNSKLGKYVETDPAFAKSAASGITQADIDKWNNKQDNFTEADPEFAKSVAAAITKDDTLRWNQALNMPASVITNVDIENWNNKLGSYTETDPAFAASIASTITKEDVENWNSKLGSYTETDPSFTQSLAAGITAADTARWNKVQQLEKLQQQPANSITNTDISNWNNKLDSYTETDPAFAQSVAAGISAADTARWNKLEKNAGNSITESQINLWNNKLDSYSETDPFFRSSVASGITKADTARWNKLQMQAANNITNSDIQNWDNKLSEETDPTFAQSLAAGITATDTARWNLAQKQPASAVTSADIQSWNNKLSEETDPTFAQSLAAGITATDTARWNLAQKQPASAITSADIKSWNNKLSEETDPMFAQSLAAGITVADTVRWNKALKQPASQITTTDIAKWNNKLDEESDPAFIKSVASGITKVDTARWNKVLKLEKQASNAITSADIDKWNNKLDSYTESDPEFGKSVAAGISAKDTARWNKLGKSAAATITEGDIEYWNDIINQFPDNITYFVNDAHYVTQKELSSNNNNIFNLMLQMEKYYEDSLKVVAKERMVHYSDSVRAVMNQELDVYKENVTQKFNAVNNAVSNMPAAVITPSDIANWNNKLDAETDPAFTASAAAGITAADIDNWNAKMGSYTESDPTFAASEAAKISATDVSNWNSKLSEEVDPAFAVSEAAKITATDITNWNNKLDSYTETDPVFAASEAAKITADDVTKWNNKKVGFFENDAQYIAKPEFDHYKDSINAVIKAQQDEIDDLKKMVLALVDKEKATKYLVTLVPAEGGAVSGGGYFPKDSIITVKATPNYGYEFDKWSDGDLSAERNIKVASDYYLAASFKKKSYTVTVTSSPAGYGVVSEGGTYTYLSNASVSAVANSGYDFVKWSDGATTAERVISVDRDTVLNAEFEKKKYTLALSATPAEGGTVTGAGKYENGSVVRIGAVAAEGYEFSKWSDGNINAERKITVTANAELSASFIKNVPTIVKNNREFVDLGLPSGFIWAKEDAGFGSGTDGSGAPYYNYWSTYFACATDEAFNELAANCTITTEDGKIKVTGPNGNYIYFKNASYWVNSLTTKSGYVRVIDIPEFEFSWLKSATCGMHYYRFFTTK